MKFATFWIVLFLPLAAWSQNPQPQPSPATDLTTLSGLTYKMARIQTIDRDSITFFHAGGAVSIPFDDLPQEFRIYQAAPSKQGAGASPGATAAVGSGQTEATLSSDPLGGAVVAGFVGDSVLLRMPDGSLVGKKLKELDARTLARVQAMATPQPTASGSGRGNK